MTNRNKLDQTMVDIIKISSLLASLVLTIITRSVSSSTLISNVEAARLAPFAAAPFVNSSSFYLTQAGDRSQTSTRPQQAQQQQQQQQQQTHKEQHYHSFQQHAQSQHNQPIDSTNQWPSSNCLNGFSTFEISTGFIYKPAASETLATLPSTLQLTDCLGFCLQNSSCLAINFEMGLCVLLSSSAKHNSTNLYSSQFPVFTIYAEKLCFLTGDQMSASKQRRRCQRAWTFERVAGFEMKTKPRRRLKLANKELCMEACLIEQEFECRSANWYRQTNECSLSDQDRHSIAQMHGTLGDNKQTAIGPLYGPSDVGTPTRPPAFPPGLYQHYYHGAASKELESSFKSDTSITKEQFARSNRTFVEVDESNGDKLEPLKNVTRISSKRQVQGSGSSSELPINQSFENDLNGAIFVDYLENNCIQEPNRLCEFRKVQNKVLKTVDSIYQDIATLEECKQKCLTAPYRCYSFDYGDTSDRVCRTSHLDQISLLTIKEPYLEVVGAVTYELTSCFNVTIQCKAKEMLVQVSSSKSFKGRIYAKSRPNACVNDVKDALSFDLPMKYHDPNCDVKLSSNKMQGIFSNDIVIQHHDRVVTSQDVGLSVYCQYDLSNKSIVSTVDLAVERYETNGTSLDSMESKTSSSSLSSSSSSSNQPGGSHGSPISITSLATTVVRSPNVVMRITNLNGQPVTSATVGDRLALMFEIKEKTSPFGIFVRDIIAMDGKQIVSSPNDGNVTLIKDEMINDSLGQSVLLIDSDGCPTDANIMGQLVKMDSTGRRLLAPFDAFKFPSSDVVFFRAVISTCVSECKPVSCFNSAPLTPYSALPQGLFGLHNDQQQTTISNSGRSSNHSDYMIASTRSMTTPGGNFVTQASLSPSPSLFGSSSTTLNGLQTSSRSVDDNSNVNYEDEFNTDRAGTTIAVSFTNDQPTTPLKILNSTTPRPMTSTQESESLGLEQAQAQGSNLTTNNHQLNQRIPPPRRTTPTAGELLNAVNELPPLSMDILGDLQRDQLVKLFTETRQRFAQAISGSTGSNQPFNKSEQQTDPQSHLAKAQGSGADSSMMDEDSRSILAKLDTIINYLETSSNGASNVARSNELDDSTIIINQPKQQLKASLSENDQRKELGSLVELNNNNSNEVSDLFRSNESSESLATDDGINFEENLRQTYEQQLNELKREARAKLENLEIQATNRTETSRAKRDSGSLAWPGQAVGSPINRRVYHEQVQSERVAPSVLAKNLKPGSVARFTRSLIEIYPHNDDLKRDKRQTKPSEEPEDSLLVQSIKILDRIEFNDEEKNLGSTNNKQIKGKQSLMKAKSPSSRSLPGTFEANNNRDPIGTHNWGAISVLLLVALVCFVIIQVLLFASLAFFKGFNSSKQRENSNRSTVPSFVSSAYRSEPFASGELDKSMPLYMISAANTPNPSSPSLSSLSYNYLPNQENTSMGSYQSHFYNRVFGRRMSGQVHDGNHLNVSPRLGQVTCLTRPRTLRQTFGC